MNDSSSSSQPQERFSSISKENNAAAGAAGANCLEGSLRGDASCGNTSHTEHAHPPFSEGADRLNGTLAEEKAVTSTYSTLPHVCDDPKDDGMTRASAILSPTRCLETTTTDKKCSATPHKCPSYNVRTVVRREHHPLWSPSVEVQLQYLYGSDYECLPQLSRPPIGDASSARHWRPSSSRAEHVVAEETPYCAVGESSSQGVANGRNVSPLLMSRSMTTVEARETGNVSLEKRTSVAGGMPREVERRLPPLKLREFATLIQVLLREECVGRQVIVEEERYEALCTLPLPPHAACGALHPAVVSGSREIILMEEICRRYLLEEESARFAPLWDFYIYAHRCVVLGTAPLARFLRLWVWGYRGRKKRQLVRRESLLRQESISRSDIMAEWRDAQQKLFTGIVTAQETLFRICIQALQIHTQYAHGIIHMRTREHVDIFPLLYGAVMPRALVCGRISGVTVFKQLDLHEQFESSQLAKREKGDRTAIACTMRREELVRFSEVSERQWIIRDEFQSRVRLEFLLLAMWERCHRREVEIVEACERQLDVDPKLQVEPTMKGNLVDDDDDDDDGGSRSSSSCGGSRSADFMSAPRVSSMSCVLEGV